MKHSQANNNADTLLYKVYWKLYLGDILYHLGFEPTDEARRLVHEFHKKMLGYSSIAGRSQEVVQRFLAEVLIFWAEQGIFVRSSGKQPLGIHELGLSDLVKVGNEYKKIWELL